MTGNFSYLFDVQSAQYAEYRPSYPRELYEKLFKYCDFQGQPGLALDIATGSGQAAVELAKIFTKVLAIDSNVQQLKQAKEAPNIEYRKGLAEETGAHDKSVDLITVAQALHWFDFSKFWCEAARVLKPGGILATWGYGLPTCKDNPEATKLIADWGYGDDVLGPYWAPRRRLVDEEYVSIIPDKARFSEPTRTRVSCTSECTIDFFIGYLSSWSSYSTYRQRHPDKEDPLIQIKNDIMASFRADSGAQKIVIEWSIFMMMAKAKQ